MFSYIYYKEILELLKRSGKAKTFHEVQNQNPDQFVIMRHDVEFSIDRAHRLAVFEHDNSFISTFFFQLTNNSYNVLSGKNRQLLKEINEMGHVVGLHYHMNGIVDLKHTENQIRKEIDVISSMLGFEVNSFSIHRPTVKILRANIKLEGIINAYDNMFFGFTTDVEKYPPAIKYISDARHQWNYRLEPNEATIMNNDKIQILTHPYSWTPTGYDNLENFRTLTQEKRQELFDTINDECKHFAEVYNAL